MNLADLYARVRRRVQHWKARRGARSATRRRLQAGSMRRLLVVCYGNIYRSPFVARYLRDKLGARVEIRSAGFHPVTDRESPPRHVTMSKALGIDLADHRSRLVTPDDLVWADTIVLMDAKNWQLLVEAGADPAKFVWLGALQEGPVEVADPYQLHEEAARRVLQRMLACSEALRIEVERSSC